MDGGALVPVKAAGKAGAAPKKGEKMSSMKGM